MFDRLMKCLTLLSKDIRLDRLDDDMPGYMFDGETLLALVSVEEGDDLKDVDVICNRIGNIFLSPKPTDLPSCFSWPLISITILPFAHLSEYSSGDIVHVSQILIALVDRMRSISGLCVNYVKLKSTRSLFINLALFDTVLTSKLSITTNSIRRHFEALSRIISYDNIFNILRDMKGSIHD